MFKHSELSKMGAKNLCSYLKNYIDYDKYAIDIEKYTDRLEYLYGWLYSRAALKDMVMVNIALIESHLFEMFSVDSLLNNYTSYEHLLLEYEEISFVLAKNTYYNEITYPISEYLLEYFNKLVLVGGSKYVRYNHKLIDDIKNDLFYSLTFNGNRSNRFYTRAQFLKNK